MNGDTMPVTATTSNDDMTTIGIPLYLKFKLDRLKAHPREPYYQVVERYLPDEGESDGPKKL